MPSGVSIPSAMVCSFFMVTTHSSPTFSIAWATKLPIWTLQMVVTCTISAAAVMGLMWEERRREEFEDTVDGSLGEWLARARTVAVVVTTRYFVRLLSNVLNKA